MTMQCEAVGNGYNYIYYVDSYHLNIKVGCQKLQKYQHFTEHHFLHQATASHMFLVYRVALTTIFYPAKSS